MCNLLLLLSVLVVVVAAAVVVVAVAAARFGSVLLFVSLMLLAVLRLRELRAACSSAIAAKLIKLGFFSPDTVSFFELLLHQRLFQLVREKQLVIQSDLAKKYSISEKRKKERSFPMRF